MNFRILNTAGKIDHSVASRVSEDTEKTCQYYSTCMHYVHTVVRNLRGHLGIYFLRLLQYNVLLIIKILTEPTVRKYYSN